MKKKISTEKQKKSEIKGHKKYDFLASSINLKNLIFFTTNVN